uniref:ANK_REP_REGION domain-containing protein n=1 Tax=Macrostomum lignano TaxID=282301 RepID=A0A1I8HXA5_9PLAT
MSEDIQKSLLKMMKHSERRLEKSDIGSEKDKVERNLFFASVASGNNRSVHSFLLKGIDPNATNEEGRSGLHIAALSSHQDVFGTLLTRGANSDQADKSGITPLMCAAQSGSVVIVDQLLGRGADVTKKTNDGLSAVFYALFNGNTKIAKKLEKQQSCIHQLAEKPTASILEKAVTKNWIKVVRFMHERKCDVSYRAKLVLASQAGLCGHTEMLQYFPVKFDDKVDEDGRSPLRCAVQNGFYDAVKYMLDEGCDVNNNEECVKIAILTGHLDILKLLREKGAPLYEKDEQGVTPIQLALAQGTLDMLKYLLDQGCSLEAHEKMGNLPIMAVSMRQTELPEVLKFLSEKGLKIDEQDPNTGETALLAISQKGPIQAIEFLIDQGCNLSVKNQRDVTPALRAAHNKQEDILMLLGERGAELDIPNRNGETAILCAARNKSLSMVRFLAEKGCKLDTRDILGHSIAYYAVKENNATNNEIKTAMHYACMDKTNDALMHLLEAESPFDTQDHDGMTPFMISSAQGSESLVTVLKSVGADVNRRNHAGENAVHLAVKSGNLKVVQCFSLFGCVMDQEDNCGITPLMIACSKNELGMVRFLVKKNRADVNAIAHNGRTPAHFACQSGSLELLKLLHSQGAELDNADNNGVTPIFLAAANQNEAFLVYLSNSGCQLAAADMSLKTVLHYAVEGKNEAAVRSLLERDGIDPNALDDSGTSPVMLSVQLGSDSILEALRKKGGRIDETFDQEWRSIAHMACATGNLRLLHETKGQVSLSSRTKSSENCLTIACANGHEEIVNFLIQSKVHISYKNSQGDNALIVAVKSSNLKLVPVLLKAGAKAQDTNKEGNNAAHVLCSKPCTSKLDKVKRLKMETDEHLDDLKRSIEKGLRGQDALKPKFLEVVSRTKELPDHLVKSKLPPGCVSKKLAIKCLSKFFESGTDVNAQNNEGKGALHFAAEVGSKEMIRFLLSKGALIDLKDKHGETPVFGAIRRGKEKVAELLLDRGASASSTNNNGLSVFSLAVAVNSVKVVELLRQTEASLSIDHVVDELKLEDIFKFQNVKHLEFLLSRDFDGKKRENGMTILHHLILAGDIQLLRAVRRNPKCSFLKEIVNDQDADGNSALHLALMTGRLDMAAVLSDLQCRTDLRNARGHLPLHVAVSENKLSLVRWLFDHCKISVRPDAEEPEGTQSPLHLSATMGNLLVFEYLQQKNFKPETVCSNKNNCAHYAAIHGNLHILEAIFGCPERENLLKEENCQNLTPLLCAILNGHERVARFLYEKNPVMPPTAINLLVQRGHQQMFDWVSKTERPGTALLSAVCSGNLHLIKKLIRDSTDWQKNIDEDQQDSFAHVAASFGHGHLLRFLNDKQVNLDLKNKNGDTPLLKCASSGHLVLMKLLQEFNCIVEEKNEMDRSIVHLASIGSDGRRGHLKVLKFASDQQLPLDEADSQGNTGLMYACRRGFKDIAEYLASSQCDANKANSRKLTAVHLAVLSGRSDILEVLYKHGADLNATDANETTPLMIAAYRHHLDCMSFLVDRLDEAAICKQNKFGWTALKIARRSGLPACATSEMESMLSRKIQLPPESEHSKTIPEEEIVTDIDMNLSAHQQRQPLQVDKNLAVEENPQELNNDEEDRSSNLVDTRCRKPKLVADLAVVSGTGDQQDGQNEPSAVDEDKDEEEADSSSPRRQFPSVEQMSAMPVPGVPPELPNCAQQ